MKEQWKQRLKRLASWTCTAVLAGALCCIFSLVYQVHGYASPRIAHNHPYAQASSGRPAQAATAPTPAPASVPPVVSATDVDRWSNGDVLTALTSFYQTIITILIALLGLVGVLSVLTLRFLSHATAEETAHKAAQRAMEQAITSKDFYDKLDEAVEQSEISRQLERLETDKAEILKQLEKLQARIGALEAGRQGPPDDESANGTITNPDA